MGPVKEYADRAVQTDTGSVPSPYADPAVVLAAPPVTDRHDPIPVPSPPRTDSPYAVPWSPLSPVLVPLVSRRPSKRRHAVRCTAGDIVNQRIVSMPENKSDVSSTLSHGHGRRIVSMPDRVRPVLEPSAELFQSPSPSAGDSFGSYSGRRDRVRVFRTPSDIPQTPSPPSSPESLLIIAAGTQLPEGFLRRKCSPEPLVEEDEDWITWANSPPRPIPALHGPLSLPYARCPSGAEGTIIEEPESVAQMIWGLGPDDQAHNQIRADILSSHPENLQSAPSRGFNQVPPQLPKKKTLTAQQVPKTSRTLASAHPSQAKQSLSRTQRQTQDGRRGPLSRISPDTEAHQDVVNSLSWNEGQSTPTFVGIPKSLVNDADLYPVDNNCILEWQLARLRQALRTSLADMDSYGAYSGRLEPVIPATSASGLPHSYPRIFVEPRPNEPINSVAKQPPIEMAQQYHHQQLYRQALQKQKLQAPTFLPTPPNSSSPQWSSHFSPYLTYCSTFSPELAGSTEHPFSVPSQKHRSGANAAQHIYHGYNRHEHDNVNSFDTNINISSTQKTPQIVSGVNTTASLRQSSSSSSTLAKYIKQLQALSPTARFSPLQLVPAQNAPLAPWPSTDENTVDAFRSIHSSPIPTPPSPESPRTLPRGPSYNGRSMPAKRPKQRSLPSVPEEDSALLELSTSLSQPELQNQATTDSMSPNQDGTEGHQTRYLGVPSIDLARKSAVSDLPELESNLGTPSVAFHHDTSPAKVRLPVSKEHNIREHASGYHDQNKGQQQVHRKKYRYKKLRGPTHTNEQASIRGLVG